MSGGNPTHAEAGCAAALRKTLGRLCAATIGSPDALDRILPLALAGLNRTQRATVAELCAAIADAANQPREEGSTR